MQPSEERDRPWAGLASCCSRSSSRYLPGCGRPAPCAPRRRARSRTCSSSPRRAASGTTRSPQGITAIQQLGAANGFTVTATEDAGAFTDANLAGYDVVVFLSTTGEVLDDTQQAAFERYIQSGGGYAGIHAASDTEYSWPWYGELVGGYFRNHPAGTPTATVEIEDARRAVHHRPAGGLDARGRVVQLPAPDDPGGQRQRDDRGLQPARPPREGPRDGRRVDLRRGRRQHRRRRPPRRLVLELRRRHLVVHGDGPHAGLVRRRRLPRPPARRPAHGRRRRRRLRRAALDAAVRGGLREGHARRRHQGPDGDRRSPRTAACSTSSSASPSPAARPTRPPPS